MKTDELVSLLAAGATPVDQNTGARRLGLALAWGGLGAALLMAVTLGVRSDLGHMVLMPMFWLKLAFSASLATAGVFAVE
ncbi:MAG: NrsF family protein, partial [Polaromonas sp.]